MSFPRHPEIFPSDEDASRASVPAHRLDEFPAGYSLPGCAPALPASVSPTASEYAVTSSCRSMIFHRPVNCVLTVCLTSGDRSIDTLQTRSPPSSYLIRASNYRSTLAVNYAFPYSSSEPQLASDKAKTYRESLKRILDESLETSSRMLKFSTNK